MLLTTAAGRRLMMRTDAAFTSSALATIVLRPACEPLRVVTQVIYD
jgi:hypothetical protein